MCNLSVACVTRGATHRGLAARAALAVERERAERLIAVHALGGNGGDARDPVVQVEGRAEREQTLTEVLWRGASLLKRGDVLWGVPGVKCVEYAKDCKMFV